jgi:F-type H+-transporting ATPase subunit delta
MTTRATAVRYARALLDVSVEQGVPERVEKELAGFLSLLAEHDALGSALASPAVPPARKRVVVERLIELDGGLSDVTTRLLMMLADRDRLALLGEVHQAFAERLMERQGVIRTTVTTASPLDVTRVEDVKTRLTAATGKNVTMDTTVDPDLIGGMVTQIGSTVFDGSIARHLERLRARFLGEA